MEDFIENNNLSEGAKDKKEIYDELKKDARMGMRQTPSSKNSSYKCKSFPDRRLKDTGITFAGRM